MLLSRKATQLAPRLRRYAAASHTGDQFNEFRHNLATGEWVVFSSGRRGRPQQMPAIRPAPPLSSLPAHDASCPFCRGNEHETPPATYTRHFEGSDRWRLRVVPNKFPAVMPASAHLETDDGRLHGSGVSHPAPNLVEANEARLALESVAAVGFHEVLIETPEHNLPTALADVSNVECLVTAMRSRGREMVAADPTLRHIMYFKNSGPKAGASLMHPHSQIVALPIVPVEVAQRQRHARQWFLRFQRNVFEHTLETTMRQRDAAALASESGGGKHRVVFEHDDFVCFVPFAALSPCTLWIVPKRPTAHFHLTSDAESDAFARALHQALRCLHFGLDEPDFNLVIRSAALEAGAFSVFRPEVFFRWYCVIIPRLGAGSMGGFEFSTGIHSNSSFPEDDAAFLRSVDPDGVEV
mgnify:CR=1 FL=1